MTDFPPIEGISPARRKDDDQAFLTPGASNGAVTWSSPNVRSFGSDPRSQRPFATRHSSDNAIATASSPSASPSTGRSDSYNLRQRPTPGASPSSGSTIADSPPS
ncbi:unnamed protein product [Fusarium equiseti]|uniref:Uncharacterized protein n=1 Tax=Fusarium equiseti TaxID=61235 RepID=A0A8J2NDL2_FUSEQ|nr:unnamed protein product [Fusarium equiseti]